MGYELEGDHLRDGYSETALQVAYNTLLQGADVLSGGDSRNDCGVDRPDGKVSLTREIIDFDVRPDNEVPALYADPDARLLMEKGGVGDDPETRAAAVRLVTKHNLLDMAREIAIRAQEVGRDTGTLQRNAQAIKLIIDHRYAMASGNPAQAPKFEDLYGTVTGRAPEPTSLQRTTDDLMWALKRAGYQDVTKRNLAQTVARWRAEARNRELTAKGTQERVEQVWAKISQLTYEKILDAVDFRLPDDLGGRHLQHANFGNLERRVGDVEPYSAYSLYLGGEEADGKPKLRGLFGLNANHPNTVTTTDHVFAHEGFPGHHLQNVVMDLRRRAGQLGQEAATGTTHTPFHVLQEGWAQQVLPILAGGTLEKVSDEFGPDLAVELALVAFQDAAKHDASIKTQLYGVAKPVLQDVFARRYHLAPHVAKKVTGDYWTRHQTFGPMVGPTYRVGSEGVRDAIEKYGVRRVLEAALHAKGLSDFVSFKEELAKPQDSQE